MAAERRWGLGRRKWRRIGEHIERPGAGHPGDEKRRRIAAERGRGIRDSGGFSRFV
jgi:hypothetical protein